MQPDSFAHRFILISVALLLIGVYRPLPAQGRTYHSSDFGWTAGQDVTSNFANLISNGTMAPGATLILDHTYRISGTHQLPDDFTLSAKMGAGFDVTDSWSNKQFLRLGNRNVLDNLTIKYLDTPDLGSWGGTNPKHDVHFTRRTGIVANGTDDVTIQNCLLEGSIAHHMRISSTNRIQVTGTHIRGGFWTVYMLGTNKDTVFRNTAWELCQGDGVKTVRGGTGAERILFDNCLFQDNGRDGIDTTGGFKDSVVQDTVFRRLFSGMDIKSGYGEPSHLTDGIANTGIDILNCRFTDTTAISLSTLDRGFRNGYGHLLNTSNCHDLAPHDIDLDNCIFEVTGRGGMKMILMKGGHTVRYSDAQFWTNGGSVYVAYTNVYDTFGPNYLSEAVSDALNYGVTGTIGPAGTPGLPGDTSIPFRVGPIPEPGTAVLVGLGAAALAGRRASPRCRSKASHRASVGRTTPRNTAARHEPGQSHVLVCELTEGG